MTVDDATLSQKTFSCDFQATVSIWTGRPDVDLTLSTMYDPELGFCKNRYNIPEATQLLNQIQETTDTARRKELYSRLGDLIVNQVMDIPLIYPNTNVVLTKAVENFQVWGDGNMRWDEVALKR